MLCYLLIGLNDIGVKIFGYGVHDSEGQGWLTVFFFVFGVIPTVIMLFIQIVQDRSSTIRMNVVGIFVFAALVYVHLQVFGSLGLH